jgi:uncharacterized protein YyaL (SSP411 family)
VDDHGEPRIDVRRFADAAAAMISAECAARAAGLSVTADRELLESAPDGAVPHELGREGEPTVRGFLDDQALAIAAALDDHAATGAPASLDFARRVADWSLRHLLDPMAGAFAAAPTSPQAEPALPPMHPLTGNGRMALSLSRLGAAAGRPELTRWARQVVESLGPRGVRSPAGATLALAALALAPEAR